MKFDMHIKKISNMKFNNQIFKIHKYIYIYIYEKFEEFLLKLVWRETLFAQSYLRREALQFWKGESKGESLI